MKKAATSGQFREFIAKLLAKMSDEKLAQIEHQQIQNAIDQADQTASSLVDWINNNCQIAGSRFMQFLTFVCEVSIPKVKEFVVGEFYKHRADEGIRLYIGDNFKNWIVNPMKEMKVSLTEESKLKKHLLKKNAWDTEIHTDFSEKPIIPVKKFVAQLQAMISAQPNGEVKKDGLDASGKSNIFNVDLSELGDKRVVVVSVYWYGGGWDLHADDLDYSLRWRGDDSFFAPATA